MEKQIAQFTNRGMYQDVSISKATNEFAFENRNIRITALDDHTLFSVTNERGTATVKNSSNEDVVLTGTYLGHAVLNDVIIFFTHYSSTDTDYIHKFTFENDVAVVKELYHGNLNFDNNHLIQTLPYYESEEVQKIYWVDGNNSTRFINICKPCKTYESTRTDIDTQFDFIPTVANGLEVDITKEYKNIGLFPSGVIQYFITYYNKYGAETPVLWSSSLHYLNHIDRGAKADEVLTCNFNLNIKIIDTPNFDFLRVYSLKRTSLNGEVQVNIVKDVELNSSEFNVVDTNISQIPVDPTLLYFIGGKDFVASTITQKDNTLFLGDVEEKGVVIDAVIKEAIQKTIKEDGTSQLINFGTKTIQLGTPEGYYTYNRQSNQDSFKFKTFKFGEYYRFAIQFQDKKGNWTAPVWIGDKKCEVAPDSTLTSDVKVANAVCNLNTTLLLTNQIKESIINKYKNYRVLMADTTFNKTIIAQGVVCPTLFNYKDRVDNSVFSVASWIMRPRKGTAAWRHMESTDKEIQGTNNLPPVNTSNDEIKNSLIPSGVTHITDTNAVALCFIAGIGKRLKVATVKVNKNKLFEEGTYEVVNLKTFNTNSWSDTYDEFEKFFSTITIDKSLSTILTVEQLEKFCKNTGYNIKYGDIDNLYTGWEHLDGDVSKKIFKLNSFVTYSGLTSVYFIMDSTSEENPTEVVVNTGIQDVLLFDKKNNYYVDNSILTFHSPDLECNKEYFKDKKLNFNIVGIVPITSTYSDVDIQLKTQGLSVDSHINKDVIINYPNLTNKAQTITVAPLYTDYGWIRNSDDQGDQETYVPDRSSYVDYDVYMWNKQGSIIGQTESTFQNDTLNTFNELTAELKEKTFANQRFSFNTLYTAPWNSDISNVQYIDHDNIELTQFQHSADKGFYSGNEDTLLTFTIPYKIGDLDQYDPVRIKYKSTPHVLFSLFDKQDGEVKPKTLPSLLYEDDSFDSIYGTDYAEFPWKTEKLSYSSIKTLGFYYHEGDVPNYGNNSPEWQSFWNNLWWPRIQSVISSDDLYPYQGSRIFYIFFGYNSKSRIVGDYNYPVTIKGVVKVKISSNALQVPTILEVYNQSQQSYPDLHNKTFNIRDIINNKEVYDGYGAFKLEDFPSSYITVINGDISNFKWETTTQYYTKSLQELEINYPYLYLAELSIDTDNPYGDSEEYTLENTTWYPITEATASNADTTYSEGDTYYQRWNCLKTYPYTEDDINKVVDITSFMVESRINLEGNTSKRIGTTNITTTRPSNFNLYNDVYNQTNNFFSYNILDEKYNNTKRTNQITWSLNKNILEDVDTWTNISLSNTLNLDGSKGKLTKLINFNDTILAFQDKSISVVSFNNRTALSTESGVPIEILNSNKVDGYRVLSSTSGCTDKNLICVGGSGLYYLDVYNSSLYRFNSEGLNCISDKGMSVWFKNNAKNIKRLLYDSTTQDLYIVTNTDVLLFNEKLQAFTTFVDYLGPSYKALFNVKGNSFILSSANNIHLYKMYAGGYASNYKMVYRVNPDPLMDKVFTNIEYLSELYDSTGVSVNKSPFESLEVKNEYQYGKTLISNTKYPTNKRKFRIWRMDLPRDTKSKWGLDRIRSPWITLTLNGKNNGERLEFHNLNVIYYR